MRVQDFGANRQASCKASCQANGTSPRLCQLLNSAFPAGSVVVLDFDGVELVTGSWVNAMFGSVVSVGS
jgi:hypothetical protein